MDSLFYHYWGKTRREKDDSGGDDYHLLVWHSLDVAACGYQLVKRNHWKIKEDFAALGLPDEEKAATFFAWLLCWHDTGKFAHLFQQQCRYPALNLNPKTILNLHYHHTDMGQWLWRYHFKDRIHEFIGSELAPYETAQALERWMSLSVGHHGKPAEERSCALALTDDNIAAAALFLTAIKRLFPDVSVPTLWTQKAWRKVFTALSWKISAVVVLADWLGSSTRYFPRLAQAMPLETYWQRTLAQAQRSVDALPAASPVAPFSGVKALFPFISTPTPLQQKAQDVPLSAPGPQLFILEDVTGAGKTEAALILAQRLMASGRGSGLYIGLPTMATANAMYERMCQHFAKFYQEGARPSLMLAHSARHLSDVFSRSLWNDPAPQSDERADEAPASQGCAAWFADSRKKALLAEIGVGTLDQALMAVMPFRHQNLRLLGLSNKILIVDEVHAYDAYLSRLLQQLIETHAAQGGSTILLSATLSQQLRDALMAAFQRGVGNPGELPAPLGLNDYPWFIHLARGHQHQQRLETRTEVKRRVGVTWLHDETACLARIRDAVEQGKCICWIRNSVDDAVRSYRQLREAYGIPEQHILLFHSRFAFADRLRIEEETLRWFGKNDHSQRKGKVVIATQVLEQSLDIDVDDMISDLAPVDLLIQRAGRLQRHVRDKQGRLCNGIADARPAPQLVIFAPEWNEYPSADWLSAAMRNTSFVYPDHSCLWLTQRVLREQGEIRMPDSARLLIESVYGDVEERIPPALCATQETEYGRQLSERAEACNRLIQFSAGYCQSASALWDEEMSTRPGDPTRDIWLARRRGTEITPYASGEHAWEMSALRVRESWWQKQARYFTLLDGDALQRWCRQQHKKEATVIVLPDALTGCGYSAQEGLTGKEKM